MKTTKITRKRQRKGRIVKTEKGSGKSASPSKTPNKSPTNVDKGDKAEESNEVWRWWEEERHDDGVKGTFLEHEKPKADSTKKRKQLSDDEDDEDYEEKPKKKKKKVTVNQKRGLGKSASPSKTPHKTLTNVDKGDKAEESNEVWKWWEEERHDDGVEGTFLEHKKLKADSTKKRKQLFDDEDYEEKPKKKKKKVKTGSGKSASPRKTPHKTVTNVDKGDKAEGSNEVWRWWEEERHDDGVKGTFLEHEKPKADSTKKRKQLSDDEDDEDYEEKPKHKDWQKYEMARQLHKTVDKIRAQYREDWTSKEMRVRQRAVALYFIDKLAFRTGSEKEEGETADTVDCCSLCNEHLTLHEKYKDQENVVEFDFLGKDSIRYYNRVTVEKRVFKNLQLFMENKSGEDEVFDRLNTEILNKYLNELMEGLTAKVFRTYNASHTLQEQLNLLTELEDPIPAKILSYNRANRAVAVLCNYQRATPQKFSKQIENLQVKIDDKKAAIKEAKKLMKDAKSDYKNHKSEKTKSALEKRNKAVQRLEEQLTKLEVQVTDKEENKEIAPGTSKLNYVDPRISVAWCKKWEVPLEKIYNKTQREKFRWAIDMATAEFEF